jgi:thiol-disulfide isomerase/thioredoxin
MLVYSDMLPLNTPAPSFTLPDQTDPGRTIVYETYCSDIATVVMFLCNHCPYVQLLQTHLVDFVRRYQQLGVVFIAINANDVAQYPEDGPVEMTRLTQHLGFTFPYCFDATQTVAKAFSAACTPDFYVFDGQHKLAYRGRYDQATPGNAIVPSGQDLAAALDAVLAGQAVSAEQFPSMGCNIKWRP